MLEHLKYGDGVFETAGFHSIRAIMEEEYALRGTSYSCQGQGVLRKFKENPAGAFVLWTKTFTPGKQRPKTPVYQMTSLQIFTCNNGLRRHEHKDVFGKVGGLGSIQDPKSSPALP